MGDTRFELVTPSVSGKCATSAPTARVMLLQANFFVCLRGGYESRTRLYGFAGRCLTAWLTHRKVCQLIGPRADNGTRTRGLNLGKVALYQLSYVRMCSAVSLPEHEHLLYSHFRNSQISVSRLFWTQRQPKYSSTTCASSSTVSMTWYAPCSLSSPGSA